jgi:hypothetical protein
VSAKLVTAKLVTASYSRLFEVKKSFRMSKHYLQVRPIYHRERDSSPTPSARHS